MADLSKAQTRVAQSDRPTRRRDSIISSRRDTEAPQRRAANDIRSGSRGDGGAEALMNLARQFNSTGDAFARRGDALNNKKDIENTIQGGLDFKAGFEDPEKMKRSLAYRAVITSSKADVVLSNWTTETKEGLQALKATFSEFDGDENKAQIAAYMTAQKKKLIVDEEGKTRDFGSPEAAFRIVDGLGEKEVELMEAAEKDSDAFVKTSTVNAFGASIFTKYKDGEFVDIEAELSKVPPEMLPEAREALIDNAYLAADALKSGDKPDFARAAQIVRELNNFNRVVSEKEPLPTLVSDGGGVSRQDADSVPTGKLPANGAITNTYTQHQGRGSNGLDIDGKIGDAVTAPAGGTVKEAGYDPKSGFFIKIDHGNGVESSYSHLNKQNVKTGDPVTSGAVIAEIGNSGRVSRRGGGDGSHLHYRVKVNGKDVDPQTHRYNTSAPAMSQANPDGTPMIDAFMAQSGEQPVVEQTSQQPGLAPITRGRVFSLNTEQRTRGLAKLEEIEREADQFADKAEAERFENGTRQVFEMFVSNNPPSPSKIREFVENGDLAPSVGYQFLQTLQSNADRVEAKANTAQAEAEDARDAQSAIDLTTEEIKLRAGQGPTTVAGFWNMIALKRARKELGSPKQEAAAMAGLFSAYEAGRAEVQRNPSFKVYGDAVAKLFAPAIGVAGARGQKTDSANMAAAMDEYTRLTTQEGMSGAQAFAEVRKKFATTNTTSTDALSRVRTTRQSMEAERGK